MTNIISKTVIFLIGFFALVQVSFADEFKVTHDHNGFEIIRIDNVGLQLEVTVGDDFEIEVEGDVDLKGAGNIEVYASEKVNTEIHGMGNIEVYGDPEDVTTSDGWFSNISIH